MKASRWLWLLLALVLAVAIALIRRGGPAKAEGSIMHAAGDTTGQGGKLSGEAPRAETVSSRDASRKPDKTPLVPRPISDIRKSLFEQADKVIGKGLGGADDAAKQDLTQRMKDLEAMSSGGLAPTHPSAMLGLAAFSRKLDQLGAYDESAWKTGATAYLQKRLAEADALAEGESPSALQERWWGEFTRDDAPEAILLRWVDNSGTKAQLRGRLSMLIQFLGTPAK